MEGQIGYFRRNHFVPVPHVKTLAELNERVDGWDVADEERRLRSRTRTIGEAFAQEAPQLRPLPAEVFETGRWFTPRVDRFAQISVRSNKYSVPVRFIGRQLRVLLHANDLVVYDGRSVIAQHERHRCLLAPSGSPRPCPCARRSPDRTKPACTLPFARSAP
ncbi:hypothetical protein ACFXKR_41605 [Streptomyces violascens]|uniref:Mu transposase domain-containing protein n=1 Tax=Streptomyces violascens TaxID=67381 RepID=UPI003687BB9D